MRKHCHRSAAHCSRFSHRRRDSDALEPDLGGRRFFFGVWSRPCTQRFRAPPKRYDRPTENRPRTPRNRTGVAIVASHEWRTVGRWRGRSLAGARVGCPVRSVEGGASDNRRHRIGVSVSAEVVAERGLAGRQFRRESLNDPVALRHRVRESLALLACFVAFCGHVLELVLGKGGAAFGVDSCGLFCGE